MTDNRHDPIEDGTTDETGEKVTAEDEQHILLLIHKCNLEMRKKAKKGEKNEPGTQ